MIGFTTIKVKRTHPDAKLPERAHNSAGYDLFACDRMLLGPGDVKLIPVGIAVEFPPGYAALIWDRSGMGRKGIHRFAGVIDADYRGNWGVILCNHTPLPHRIEVGDKIAQVVFQKVESWPIEEVTELSDTARGEGGWGSTGR